MKLSRHFTLEELCASDTALRLGIDNTPPLEVLAVAENVTAPDMEWVRAMLGVPVLVSSWFRCEALERVLCVKDFAAWCARHGKFPDDAWPEYFARKGHPKGYCVDFTAPQFGTPRQIVRKLAGSGLKFDQLIEEGSWVHGSFDPRLRGEVLTATFANGVPSYSAGVS